ncbi:YbaL family putative K(+) efflux transporter [Plastoroseomonas arctica]|uniref:Kef family K(+) transporter n=1 Tax=Plastoroseomonas arctica TaxID=1509237 RepID=A0AAF1KLY4_9PROT|nr:YbaL family putative K(+) efflux transporter [Plastoroseomonas arctica]MBR0655391.1 Kef family K(+) transporter [Plastoroseomonas arctica]
MPDHQTPLIATIAVGLMLAFLFGRVAHRVKLSPLVGYLLAGVAIGPYTPGFVADASLAGELAEIGVILLMFAVGLHFSPRELLAVKGIAIPGALVQIAAATLLGMGLAWLFGWGIGAGIVFGLALSVASTVVLLRALQDKRIAETARGHIAIGWLIVEDIAMVLALVLLPAFAGASAGGAAFGDIALTVAITLAKVAAFMALMMLAGRRVIPWIMHDAAHTGSRELFRLAVYAVALGVAFGAAKLFGVSFALGAFFAGMVMGESRLSQRAAEEALPLRDAFAVLFFVSVGMLFDPSIMIRAPLAVGATVAIIVVGKSAAAYGITRALGHPHGTALTISASLAQIGEFSFILAGLGVALGVLPTEARDLILAGAILSILLNPFIFAAAERMRSASAPIALPTPASPAPPATPEPDPEAEAPGGPPPATLLDGHTVLVGHGRIGAIVAAGLRRHGRAPLVFDESEDALAAARAAGLVTIAGNAANPDILAAGRLGAAVALYVTIADPFEAGQVVEQARAANAGLPIIALAAQDAAIAHLDGLGATRVVMGEDEIAEAMLAAGQPAAA